MACPLTMLIGAASVYYFGLLSLIFFRWPPRLRQHRLLQSGPLHEGRSLSRSGRLPHVGDQALTFFR